MADIIGQETWSAGGKSYVIKVTEPGATVTENAISIISPVRLRRGDPSYGPLEPILESQISFTIRDTGRLFRTALEGKEIGDIVLLFTEDGSTVFTGYVVPEYQRHKAYLTNPEYRVTAYDGIAGLKGYTYDQVAEQDVRDQIHFISDKIGLEVDSNVYFDWVHNGADGGTDDVENLRLRMEHMLNEGSTYYDVLDALCHFYAAQFFQSMGEWHFMQRHLRGADMTAYVTNASGTPQTDETADFISIVLDTELHREATFFSEYPATARVVSKHTYIDYLLRNADWTEGNKYWEGNGSDDVGANGGRKIDINNGYLRQTVGTTFLDVDGTNDKVYFGFNVKVDFSGSAPGGSVSVKYCEIKAIDDDGTVNYRNDAGAWQSGQTYISQSVTATPSTTQQFNATLTSAVMPFEPARIVLTLYCDKDATGDQADINWVEFGAITILHLKPAAASDTYRPTEYVVTQVTGNPGDNIEEEFSIGDTDGSLFNGVGVLEYFDGSDWIPTSDWDGSGQTIHEKRSTEIASQLGSRMKFYEFAHTYGADIDIHNAVAYNDDADASGEVYPLVFVERIYPRSGNVLVRSAGVQLLGAEVPTVWYNVSWTHRMPVTVALDKTLARVDLSNAGSSIFAEVQNGGADIRVTKADGTTEVARDVRSCDTGTETGWLVFATGESKSATTALYYIYIGNSGASDYAEDATYGRENVYDSEYAMVLSMDEDPSGTAPQMIDRTANDNDGTTVGSMVTGDSVTGQIDNALEFDGATQWVTVSDADSLDLTSGLTMGVTFKESGSSAGYTSLLAKRQTNEANYGINFNPDGGTDIFQSYFYDGAFQQHQVTWSTNFNSSTWYHVIATLNQNGADVDSVLYKDGTSLDSTTFTSKTLAGNTRDLYIAAAYTTFAGDEELNGQMDEIYIMNTAIGSAEAQAISDEIMDNANAVTFGTLEAV